MRPSSEEQNEIEGRTGDEPLAIESELGLDDKTEIDLHPPIHKPGPAKPVTEKAPPPAPKKRSALQPIYGRSAPRRAAPAATPPHADVAAPTGAPPAQPYAAEVLDETRVVLDSPMAAPVAEPIPSPVSTPPVPAFPVVPASPQRRSLEELLPDQPPRKRELPSRLRLALGGLGALLLFVIVFSNRGAKGPPAAAIGSPIDDDMIVSAEQLKNRREVRADDFRSRDGATASTPVPVPAPPPPARVAPAGSSDAPAAPNESLAERRARRQADPEDVLSLKQRRAGAKPSRGSTATADDTYDGPVYVTAGANSAAASGSSGAPAVSARASSTSSETRVAPAGVSISATLANAVALPGASSTIVARVDKQASLLRGARFIGSASTSGGRVVVRFRSLILADGRQARVDAEAQDDDGTFGLAAEAHGEPADESGQASVLGDVAQETATDFVSDAVGVSLAGRAIDHYVSGSRSRQSSRRPERTLSLPAGTHLQVFLHEPIDVAP